MQALSLSKASLTIFNALALALTAAIHLYAETDQIRRDEKTPQKTNDMDRHQNRKKRQRKIRKKAALATKLPLSKSETNIVTEQDAYQADEKARAIAVVENENDNSSGPCQENGQHTEVCLQFHFLQSLARSLL